LPVSDDLERMVREAYAAYNRGDFEAAARYMHPAIEWDSGETSLTGEKFRGPEAVIKQLRPDIFQSQRSDIQAIEINGGRVFVEMVFHAVGSGSGVELVTNGWQVWTFEEGLAVRVQNFLDREQARAAAGLGRTRAR
jgi:ketosteroid isomerase-like protein